MIAEGGFPSFEVVKYSDNELVKPDSRSACIIEDFGCRIF